MIGTRGRVAAAIALTALPLACGSSSRSPSGGASIAASTSAATPSSLGSSSTSATTSAAPTAIELARRHAPFYRFNAWVAGDGSPMNKNEDYFPMSVPRFLDEIASGQARVTTQESREATVATNEVKPFSSHPVFEKSVLAGYPKLMAGDPPGVAPVYAHVYQDSLRTFRKPDGSGENFFWIEYWVFYCQDVCKLNVAGFAVRVGGHRSDWEHTAFGVAVKLGPNGVYTGTEVREGLFGAHKSLHQCDVSELELVDDQAIARAGASHPVVYVSQGKHASYPEPGNCPSLFGVPHAISMDEFFRGNGATWMSWTNVHDLEDRSDPEFHSSIFPALLAPGVGPFTDWTDYKGHWGPDKAVLFLAASPEGPKAKKWYGNGDNGSIFWKDVKAHTPRMVLGPWPQVVPAPVPIRK